MIVPIIIFGGTFDPLHVGHMLIANKLYDTFQQKITFLPTGIPPYKPKPQTTTQQRLDMLNLSLNDDSRFCIDEREIKRNEYCYTYKTLREIRGEIGEQTPLFFVIGSDSLVSLDSWDNWQELFQLTNFIVVARPNYTEQMMSGKLYQQFMVRKQDNLDAFKRSTAGEIYMLHFDPVDISSTQIRNNIKANLGYENLVPTAVATYIKENRIYIPVSIKSNSY